MFYEMQQLLTNIYFHSFDYEIQILNQNLLMSIRFHAKFPRSLPIRLQVM